MSKSQKAPDSCGVYLITCLPTGKEYIGSSYRIANRWYQHRATLRKGKSPCVILQHAWTFYGEAAFRFEILEECAREVLETVEQKHVDARKPALNAITDIRRRRGVEQNAKIVASIRKRAAARTHCPKGHEYTPDNVYLGKKLGDKRCKACNRERVRAIFEAETPEQRAGRAAKGKAYHEANREARLAKQKEYVLRTKEAKRAYDAAYREIKNARRREATRMKRAAQAG